MSLSAREPKRIANKILVCGLHDLFTSHPLILPFLDITSSVRLVPQQHGSRPPLASDGLATTANSSFQGIRVHGIAGGITNRGIKGGRDRPISTICMERGDSPLRERAVRFFLSLALAERLKLLTFEDPSWCALAANMAARLERRSALEQEVRFDVQPPPVGVSAGR